MPWALLVKDIPEDKHRIIFEDTGCRSLREFVRTDALSLDERIRANAVALGFPIIPCDLCGSQDDLKRKKVKAFLREWEKGSPGCSDSIAAALANVAPSLLMDPRLFDFSSLGGTNESQLEDDAWLDDTPSPAY